MHSILKHLVDLLTSSLHQGLATQPLKMLLTIAARGEPSHASSARVRKMKMLGVALAAPCQLTLTHLNEPESVPPPQMKNIHRPVKKNKN